MDVFCRARRWSGTTCSSTTIRDSVLSWGNEDRVHDGTTLRFPAITEAAQMTGAKCAAHCGCWARNGRRPHFGNQAVRKRVRETRCGYGIYFLVIECKHSVEGSA
jgi:hypothetical protein